MLLFLLQEVLSELKDFQPTLAKLRLMVEHLTQEMDHTALVYTTGRNILLSQQVAALTQALQKHIKGLDREEHGSKEFRKLRESLDKFLSEAQGTLADRDPGESAEEKALRSRLDVLTDVGRQCSEHQVDMDRLKVMAQYCSLDAADTEDLRKVEQRWKVSLALKRLGHFFFKI